MIVVRIHDSCGAEKKTKTNNIHRSRRLTARINQLEAFKAPLRQWLVKDEETLRGGVV